MILESLTKFINNGIKNSFKYILFKLCITLLISLIIIEACAKKNLLNDEAIIWRNLAPLNKPPLLSNCTQIYLLLRHFDKFSLFRRFNDNQI